MHQRWTYPQTRSPATPQQVGSILDGKPGSGLRGNQHDGQKNKPAHGGPITLDAVTRLGGSAPMVQSFDGVCIPNQEERTPQHQVSIEDSTCSLIPVLVVIESN